MLPESMAPELENYGEFKAYMEARAIIVRRDYQAEFEDPETGELFPPYWQVTIAREERQSDRRLHCYVMTVDDYSVERAYKPQWDSLITLLEAGWRQHLERYGVA